MLKILLIGSTAAKNEYEDTLVSRVQCQKLDSLDKVLHKPERKKGGFSSRIRTEL